MAAHPRIPTATYRLQYNRNFKFTDAVQVIPYLQKLGITVAYFPIRELSEIDKAFAAMAQERPDALVIFPDYTMFVNRERLARPRADPARARLSRRSWTSLKLPKYRQPASFVPPRQGASSSMPGGAGNGWISA